MFKKLKNWVINCITVFSSIFNSSAESTPAYTPRSSVSQKDERPSLLFFPRHASDEKPTNTSQKDRLSCCLNDQIQRLEKEQKGLFVTLKSKQVKQQKIKALQEIKTAAFPALIEEDENTTNHNPSDNINLENILGKFSETRKETIINTLGQASFFSRTQRALAPYGLPKPCRVN